MFGCNYNTSNNMTRGEFGVRPLLIQVIKRVISYISNIKERSSSLADIAFQWELSTEHNMFAFVNKFNLNANDSHRKSKYEVKRICHYNYDRYWATALKESPKALSYILFKKKMYPSINIFTRLKTEATEKHCHDFDFLITLC